MIPSILFLLLRRYQKHHPEKTGLIAAHLRFVARLALLLLLMTGAACYAFSQERVLQYTINRNGEPVGSLTLKEIRNGDKISLRLQSNVKTSFLLTVEVTAQEEALYENGVLVSSSFYQKVNNNERANTKMQATGAAYKVTNKQQTTLLKNYPITYNMICLYTVEPVHVRHVFMDKYQQFVPVEVLGAHHYKLTFPDGAYNEYYYKDGLCVKVKMNSNWFNAIMELKR